MRALRDTTACRRTVRSEGGVAHSTGRLSIAACSHRADASSLTTATDYDGPADVAVVSLVAVPPWARVGWVRTGSYGRPSRHMANKMRARRRAKATTAMCLPRRCAMPWPSDEDRPSGDPSKATHVRRPERAGIGQRDGHCAAPALVVAVRPSCTRGGRGPSSSPLAPRDRSGRRHPTRRHTRSR